MMIKVGRWMGKAEYEAQWRKRSTGQVGHKGEKKRKYFWPHKPDQLIARNKLVKYNLQVSEKCLQLFICYAKLMGDGDMHQKEKRTFRLTKIMFSVIQQVSSEGRRKEKHYLKILSAFISQTTDSFLPNWAK